MTIKSKLLIYIVAYKAENHIKGVLDRIPVKQFGDMEYTILVSDDCSGDKTSDFVREYQASHKDMPIVLVTQAKNLRYGGNQKFGYNYAIENKYDAVVLLHGDGQYAPEMIPELVKPLLSGEAGVVLGSRMAKKEDALKGGMPLYKFVGNILLTQFQNILLGTRISEFHTGLRAYSVAALAKIPFNRNDDGFVFDTEILIQMIDNKVAIKDISIPTHYGNEICYVNGIQYAAEVVGATLLSRLQRLKLVKNPKFIYK